MEVIDSCTADNGNCSQMCNHTEGGPHCACYPGFELQYDHKTCTGHSQISLELTYRP